jgi:hypothetical protein
MKSALSNIGKTDIGALALKLEMLGRDNDIEAMVAETPAFFNTLKVLVKKMSQEQEEGEQGQPGDNQYLKEMLLKMKTACEAFDESTLENLLSQLRKITWPKQTKEMLNNIDEQLLHCDFDEIIASISKLIDSI